MKCCNLQFFGKFCTEDGTTVIGYVHLVDGVPVYQYFNISDGLPYLGIVYTNICSTVNLIGSAELDFGSVAPQTSEDLTIAVVGAALGDVVSIGCPAPPDIDSCYTAFVSAADTVTVRFNNYSLGTIDPAAGEFNVIVFKS